MGDEDFLDGLNEAEDTAAPAEPKVEETPPEEQQETPTSEKPRDEHGRFAPKEPAAEPAAPPAPPAEPAPIAPAAQEPQHAPLAALLDERDKRKAAEEQLRQFQARQQQAEPAQVPDMIEDPEGYHAFVNAQVEGRLYGERLFMSERLARIEHGAETFAKAKEWGVARCDADPYFNQKVRQSDDPYGVVMEEWRRDQAAAIPADELEQFRAWKAANGQLSQQQPAPLGAPPNGSPTIPPPSLASAPSAGRALQEPALSDEEMFEETFSKRK